MAQEKWLWFDVDDVLVDASTQLERSLRRLTGIHHPVHEWPSHSFADIYKIAHDRFDAMREAWACDRVLERSRVLDGSVDALKMGADKGYKIGLITARGWHPEGRQITQEMVDSNSMPVEQIIVMAFHESKSDLLLATKTDIVGFADDTPRHVEGALSCGWNGKLVSQPWNRESDLPRVASVLELVESLPPAHKPAAAPARMRR